MSRCCSSQVRFNAIGGSSTRLLRHFSDANRARRWIPPCVCKLAQTMFLMGRIADAERTVSAALAADSHAAGAHYLLAQIAERRGRRVQAEREYRSDIVETHGITGAI